jgi:hypothetical protein
MSAAVALEKQEVRRLIALMKSPGYWRDHDPEVVREVRAGFQRLYRPANSPAPARSPRDAAPPPEPLEQIRGRLNAGA